MLGVANSAAQAGSSFNSLIDKAIKVVQKRSPHTMLAASLIPRSGDNTYRPVASTMTYPEAIMGANAHNSGLYNRAAFMSFEGLIRPFTTNISGTSLPHTVSPSVAVSGINASTYNPFQSGTDIEIFTNGSVYTGMHAYRRGASYNDIKAIALRGPLVVCGWGRGIDGRSFWPSGGLSYSNNYLRRSNDWPVGPLDMRWDQQRGVWTCSDLLMGTIGAGGMTSSVSGAMNVRNGMIVPVYNWFNSTISVSSTTKVVAGWWPDDHKYYIIAMDC